MKKFALCGNKNYYDYDEQVKQLRSMGHIVYDLENTSEEHIMQDIANCDTVVVIGQANSISLDTWDMISLATIIGKKIITLQGIPKSIIRHHLIRFLRIMADHVEAFDKIHKILDEID